MEKLSLDSDSNPESTGIVEKPLPLETVCEQIAVLCEKLQGHGKNKSDRIDNGQPRCSNNEPNDIEHKLLNSMNDESSESADSALDDRFYDAVQQSFSADSDRSSNNAFSDAIELHSSNAASDIDGGEIVGASLVDAVGSSVIDDESNIVEDESASASNDSDGGWETENSDNDSEHHSEDDSDRSYGGYIDTDSEYDMTDGEFLPNDSMENFELSDALREEIWTATVESNTWTWKYKTRASVTDVSEDCSVCLTPFVDEVEVRRLPCFHVFHKDCADQWLFKQHKKVCPSCRMRVDHTSDYLNESAL